MDNDNLTRDKTDASWFKLPKLMRGHVALVAMVSGVYVNALVVIAFMAFMQADNADTAMVEFAHLGQAFGLVNSMLLALGVGAIIYIALLQHTAIEQQKQLVKHQQQTLAVAFKQQKEVATAQKVGKSEEKFNLVHDRYKSVADDLKTKLVGSAPVRGLAESLAGMVQQISTMATPHDRTKSLRNFLKTHCDQAMNLTREFSKLQPVIAQLEDLNNQKDAAERVDMNVLVDTWVADLTYLVMMWMATDESKKLYQALTGEDPEQAFEELFGGMEHRCLLEMRMADEGAKKAPDAPMAQAA